MNNDNSKNDGSDNRALLKQIASRLSKDTPILSAFAVFSDKRYSAVPLSVSNFKAIPPVKSLEGKYKTLRTAFIDAGSAEVVGAANFSLSLVRSDYTIYSNNKQVSSNRSQFFCLVDAQQVNGKLIYRPVIFDTKKSSGTYFAMLANNILVDNICFDSFDPTLRTGIHRMNPSRVIDAIRRFYELSIAIDLAKNKLCDVIVLDGTLQSSFTHEAKYLNELYAQAEKTGVIITALAKTSNIVTDSGISLQFALQSLSRKRKLNTPWYYYPVAEISHPDHRAELYFVKLHENSDYAFRFEIYKEHKLSINELEHILRILAQNSSDPVFLGYPYGLIDADKMARVSKSEASILRMQLAAVLGKNWGAVLGNARSLDAHDVLDRIG